jgi:AcrR family transcriptional regulator
MTEQKNPGTARAYRMGRRLEYVEETRERIAKATYELHATIGPAKTTISAVAERAGVQRHTVYNHFPDLTSLFRACTEHGIRVTRMPDPAAWRPIADPLTRLRTALSDLYGYYRVNARLMSNILRDMPMFADVGGNEEYLDRVGRMHATLTDGWMVDETRRPALEAAIGHAMAFETWRSLTEPGLSDDQARDMMVGFVTGIAGDSGGVIVSAGSRS